MNDASFENDVSALVNDVSRDILSRFADGEFACE